MNFKSRVLLADSPRRLFLKMQKMLKTQKLEASSPGMN